MLYEAGRRTQDRTSGRDSQQQLFPHVMGALSIPGRRYWRISIDQKMLYDDPVTGCVLVFL